MANTHHTGIPKLQWTFEYPPCTPSVTIVADKNPFCLGDSVTFTPTFACVDDVTITAYGWVVNGSIQSTSAEPFVTNTLTNGNSVYMFFITSIGQTYFSNVITMQNKTEGCITLIKYGLLYNWYAATDARNICAEGWEVPERSDFDALNTFLGGTGVAGGKLKETGFTYWQSPNSGATNEVNFNGKGAGTREPLGFLLKDQNLQMLISNKSFGLVICSIAYYNNDNFDVGAGSSALGYSVRLIKTTTTLTHGQTGTYTGNDGKVYRTICIGTQEWLADNLAETKFRNGDWIPGYDGGVYTPISNAAWANLTDSALCAYNNDLNNV